jgi:acetoin utilization protein AcuB
MLVKDCMTRHPAMVPPTMSAAEAQKVMIENKVRHLPVVGDGKKLVGLITRQRLALKPDTLLSLSVWEIARYLADLKVKDLMLKAEDVYTIGPDQTVEQAARILADYKIGCLLVIEEGVVIGVLSEVDLLRSYQEMLGLPVRGVRLTMRMPNQKGEFVKLMSVLSEQGWGVMGVGTYPSPRREGYYDAVLKIPEVTLAEVEKVFSQVPGHEIVDIREVT